MALTTPVRVGAISMEEQEIVKVRNNADSFVTMGNCLFESPGDGLRVFEGQLFEGKTNKGGRNLIVCMRVDQGNMIYLHGDKVKKIDLDTFIRAILHGDLEPKMPKEIDTERLSMATIGMDAIANRRTVEEHIDLMGEGAEERYLHERRGT